VKPFGWWGLIVDGLRHPDLGTVYQLRHNRVAIPDHARATAQHERFVGVLRRHAVVVHTVEELDDVRIQLYPRDLGFVVDDVLFLARARTLVRRREQQGLRRLLARVSRHAVLDDGIIEGGDVAVTETEVLVGLGEESDRDGARALQTALGRAGIDRRVVPLEMASRGVVHLDTKFTLVGPATALYHPQAFTPSARALLGDRFDLVEATGEETLRLFVNTLSLGPDRIVLDARADRIAAELARRGIAATLVDYDEVTRFPGGLRCATLPLVRG
jgi:N-dimethylarginine dimethylaminohydrolase